MPALDPLAPYVTAAQRGDPCARDALCRVLLPLLTDFLRHRFPESPLDAEDCAADVLVKVLTHLNTYTPRRGASFRSWVYRIAWNQAATQRRAAARRPTIPLSIDDQAAEDSLARHDRVTPDHAARCAGRADLAAALPSLTDEQRRVLFHRFVEGRTYADIGRVLGKPADAVKKQQGRALASLRRALEDTATPLPHARG